MLPMSKVKNFVSISKLNTANNNVRYYSRYPKHFVEPVVNKDEVEEIIKTKNDLEIKTMSVKAASHSATCSVFYDPNVSLLVQMLMRNGNKKLALSIVDQTLETVKKIQLEKYYTSPEDSREKIELNPRVLLQRTVENTTPVLGTKYIIRSGTAYNIPCMITPQRAKFLGMKFLIASALDKDRKKRYYNALAEEIIQASENKGKAVQKKIDLHKYCEANSAYAHYRWT